MTIAGDFERFQYFNFETNFLKKLFLVESTMIENAAFPYKTVLWKPNVKTNRKRSAKRTYYKEHGFAPNYFIFFENVIRI